MIPCDRPPVQSVKQCLSPSTPYNRFTYQNVQYPSTSATSSNACPILRLQMWSDSWVRLPCTQTLSSPSFSTNPKRLEFEAVTLRTASKNSRQSWPTWTSKLKKVHLYDALHPAWTWLEFCFVLKFRSMTSRKESSSRARIKSTNRSYQEKQCPRLCSCSTIMLTNRPLCTSWTHTGKRPMLCQVVTKPLMRLEKPVLLFTLLDETQK